MKLPGLRGVVRDAVVGLVLFFPAPCLAGQFINEIGCDRSSVEPPRYLATFWMYDRFDAALCEVKIEPISYNGSPLTPILGCTAPSTLSCEVDLSTGIATYRPPRCINEWWYFPDSLGLLIAGTDAWFKASLITTGGYVRKVNSLHFSCDGPTPAVRRTWGRLKISYR